MAYIILTFSSNEFFTAKLLISIRVQMHKISFFKHKIRFFIRSR